MAQTTKVITGVVHEEVRTDDTGGKFIVSLVTYAGGSQERIVQPLMVAKPA